MKKFNRILFIIIAIVLISIAAVLVIENKNSHYPVFINNLINNSNTGEIDSFVYNGAIYYSVSPLSLLQGSVGVGNTIYDSNGNVVGGYRDADPASTTPITIAYETAVHTLVWHTKLPTNQLE